MFEAETIRDRRGHDVVDADGRKIGLLEAAHVDTGTDLPFFGMAGVGMVGRQRLVFVPLDRVNCWTGVAQGRLRQEAREGSPSIDTDGELVAAGEETVSEHYGLTCQPGAGGERRLGPPLRSDQTARRPGRLGVRERLELDEWLSLSPAGDGGAGASTHTLPRIA
jgi:hypothetical protein